MHLSAQQDRLDVGPVFSSACSTMAELVTTVIRFVSSMASAQVGGRRAGIDEDRVPGPDEGPGQPPDGFFLRP